MFILEDTTKQNKMLEATQDKHFLCCDFFLLLRINGRVSDFILMNKIGKKIFVEFVSPYYIFLEFSYFI